MWLARVVCTWKYGASFRYGLRIWQSLSLCLGVACGVRLDFQETLGTQFLVRQWIMFCVSFERFFDEFGMFSMLRRDSYSAVLSPFSRRTEKCAQQMLQFTVFFALAHTEKSGHYFYDDPLLAVGVMILGIFAAILQHFSGSSSEFSPRVSAQALALV